MKSQILPFLMAFLALAVVNAFLPPSNMPTKRAQLQTGTALVVKAKGFGEPQENQQQKKKKQFGPERPPEVEDGTTNMLNASRDRAKNMLQEMEAKEQARRDEARAKLEELREEERAIREQPDAGVIPEIVSNRMLGRILPFIAVPVVMGIGLFYFFIVLARQYEISWSPRWWRTRRRRPSPWACWASPTACSPPPGTRRSRAARWGWRSSRPTWAASSRASSARATGRSSATGCSSRKCTTSSRGRRSPEPSRMS
ncbi:unnamed protein product [Heterosigma akashiwo]